MILSVAPGSVDRIEPRHPAGEQAVTPSVRIEVLGGAAAEADWLTGDLLSHLQARQDVWVLQRTKSDRQTMDAGTVLVAVLAAPAVVALSKEPAKELAKGIAAWMTKRRASISVDGQKVQIDNLPAQDVLRILEQILASRQQQDG